MNENLELYYTSKAIHYAVLERNEVEVFIAEGGKLNEGTGETEEEELKQMLAVKGEKYYFIVGKISHPLYCPICKTKDIGFGVIICGNGGFYEAVNCLNDECMMIHIREIQIDETCVSQELLDFAHAKLLKGERDEHNPNRFEIDKQCKTCPDRGTEGCGLNDFESLPMPDENKTIH